jgi:hypothetical protein
MTSQSTREIQKSVQDVETGLGSICCAVACHEDPAVCSHGNTIRLSLLLAVNWVALVVQLPAMKILLCVPTVTPFVCLSCLQLIPKLPIIIDVNSRNHVSKCNVLQTHKFIILLYIFVYCFFKCRKSVK